MQPIGKNTFVNFFTSVGFYKTTNHIAYGKVFKDSNQVGYAHIYELLKRYRKHLNGNCFL